MDMNNTSTESLLGFKALPLRYSKNSSDHHYIYIKEHSVRGQTEDKPKGRTLFILNVPPYANEEDLERVFSKAGEIVNVSFTQKPTSGTSEKDATDTKLFPTSKPITGFKVAYVVFKSVLGLQKSLMLKKLEPLIDTDSSSVETGIKKWIRQYNDNIIDENAMQIEIDNFMQVFDDEEAKKLQHEKSLEEADDEGWVTVTKRGRKPGFSRKESVGNKIMQKEQAGKKRKELLNFYTFQIRESKMKHLVSLRQKFEEDKKKIALLKQSRRFKPF